MDARHNQRAHSKHIMSPATADPNKQAKTPTREENMEDLVWHRARAIHTERSLKRCSSPQGMKAHSTKNKQCYVTKRNKKRGKLVMPSTATWKNEQQRNKKFSTSNGIILPAVVKRSRAHSAGWMKW